MRKQRLLFGLAALTLALPALAAAQTTYPTGSRPLFSSTGPSVTVAGAPFRAKRVGHSTQTLADGTTATQEVTGQMARDSQGRVRVDAQQAGQPSSAVILDPVSDTSLNWNSSSTTATRSTPLPRPPWHVTFPSQPQLAATESTAQDRQPQTVTTEDLGKKTVDGLVTTGTRTTTVVPTGKIVHELWFSQDLMLAIVDTFTDPKGAQQTIEIQDLIRTEPDPALFHEPQGYTVSQPAPFFGGGVLGGTSLGSVPPPPLRGPARVKLGADVQAAKIVDHAAPVYPPIARKANVQGTVVLHAIISRDGKVSQLEVVSGHPLLVQAALDAVRQWTYTPTQLNGTPVEVDTTIVVPFVLDDKP